MYLSYYGLKSKPFQISTDPTFIWLGEKHKEALATLTYGVLDNKGFMLLTGDVGTGKTTLINTLIRNLSDDVLHAFVPDPRLELNDFFNYIARAFNIKKEFRSKGQFLLHFSDFLEAAYAENKKVLLLIDEAQLLTQDLLEEIRLLSNIQKDGNNLLNIFFIGQGEFNQVLERSENRAVAQRLTLNYHLNPLSEAEVGKYIRHRLKIAGTTERLFDDGAVREIHAYSGGFPRRINILCDHCLLNGYVKERRIIDAAMVRICAHDLKIPQYTKKIVPPPRPIPLSVRNRQAEPAGAAKSTVKRKRSVETNPAPSGSISGYVSGNDDVRITLKQERDKPLLAWVMTAAVVLAGGLLIFYVLAPETFMAGCQRLMGKEMPVQQGLTKGEAEQKVEQEPAELPQEGEESQPEGQRVEQSESPGGSTGLENTVPKQYDLEEETAGDGLGEGKGAKIAQSELVVGQAQKESAGPVMISLGGGPVEGRAAELARPAEVVSEQGTTPDEKRVYQAQHVSEQAGIGQALENTVSAQNAVTSIQVQPAVVEPDNRTDGQSRVANQALESTKREDLSPATPPKVLIVRFNHDSSEFVFEDLAGLEKLVAHLKRRPEATIKISGHTDSLGSQNYNYRLSLFRANMLKSYFLGKGIDSSQMTVKGYGSMVPVASNATDAGRSQNRRVEIEVVR